MTIGLKQVFLAGLIGVSPLSSVAKAQSLKQFASKIVPEVGVTSTLNKEMALFRGVNFPFNSKNNQFDIFLGAALNFRGTPKNLAAGVTHRAALLSKRKCAQWNECGIFYIATSPAKRLLGKKQTPRRCDARGFYSAARQGVIPGARTSPEEQPKRGIEHAFRMSANMPVNAYTPAGICILLHNSFDLRQVVSQHLLPPRG